MIFATIAALCAVTFGLVSYLPARQSLPPHFMGHRLIDNRTFFDDATIKELMDLVRSLKRMNSSAREADSYSILNEDIGEAVPFDRETKTCPKQFLIPNRDKTKCVFPVRLDVGRHYILSGGPEGMKESFDTAVSRVHSFLAFLFDHQKYPVAKRLLASKEFLSLSTDVCPPSKQVLDPIQMSLVAQVPGQTVATHIDAPYFQRASRFHYPTWLLSAMSFSGLFEDTFIDQVQVVGYFHQWQDDGSRGGTFVFWNSSDPVPHAAPPLSKSANSVDGSKTVHAAAIYRPDVVPPKLPMTSVNELVYNEETGKWELQSDKRVVGTYDESELRFSVVYRARCFASEESRQQYHEDQKTPTPLEEILDVFKADLVAKHGLTKPAVDGMSRYDLGLKILDTYVKYPLSPTAWVPYNYCALDKLYPSLKPLLQWVCQ